MNQKKRRRVAAQKADTSKDMPLKANDDEPMEVDEIRQEEESEYNIDDYLDDHSKHSLITFKIL